MHRAVFLTVLDKSVEIDAVFVVKAAANFGDADNFVSAPDA